MSAQSTTAPHRFAASTQLFLLVVASSVFLTTLTGSMVNVVIPIMRAEFAVSAAQIGWIVTGYVLAYAIGVPLYGRMSDLFGVRPIFVLGLLGFATGALVCALAPNFLVLVMGRTLQGIGGAVIPALATVSVARVLPSGNRGGAMGLVASSVGIGSAVGPVVGGAVGQFWGWRALFVGSLVLALLLIPFARRVLPTGSVQAERRFDLLGGLLLGMSTGFFLFSITQGQAAGFASPSSWVSFLVATVAAVSFVWRINRSPDPFVEPELFANRAYVAAMVVGFCAMFVNLSILVFVSLLVVEVNELSPSAAGLVLTPAAVTLALLSPLAGRLSDRIGVRSLILAGLMVIAGALFWLSTLAGAPAPLIAAGIVVGSAGFAFIQSPVNNAAANALPAEAVGGGLGIFAGVCFLGAGTGPAVMGAFLAARQEAGSAALNPLYSFGAAPFSDLFLVMILALIVALLAAFRLRGKTEGHAQ